MKKMLLMKAAIAALAATTANAQKLVISEVLSNEIGMSYTGEWIEIYNGTDAAIDLSNYKIGDEETAGTVSTTEAMFQFPSGASIAPGEVQIIASWASQFGSLYGFWPTYEAGGSEATGWIDEPIVPNMSFYTAWDPDGDRLNMGNGTDQVLLMDGSDTAVDAISWGGTFFMDPAAPTGADGVSQSRFDVTIDTDVGTDWVRTDASPLGATWAGLSSPGTVNISKFLTDSDVNWSDVAAWNNGGVPNRQSWVANFTGATTAGRTVTLDIAATVGQLNFDNANGYTIAGTEVLTIDRAAGGRIDVKSGTHAISTPVAFVSDATIKVAAGSRLTLSGVMTGAAADLVKSDAGTLAVKHVRAASLNVEGGKVEVIASNTDDSTSRLNALSIADGASFDIQNNALIIDYTAAGTSPLADVTTMITSGKLTSGIATADQRYAVAVIESLSIVGGAFRGQPISAQALAIDLALKGDTDLNGSVDFNDLLALAQNYGAGATGKTWSQGDFDFGGSVDFNDLLSLAQNYGGSGLNGTTLEGTAFAEDWALAQSLVPEPGIACLLAGLTLGRRRRA
jgi:Lamin Tail Domain